ncbi:MAG: YbaB/EbfC family nucleoid-associated protein [Myxococcota bacterium]
MNPNDAEKMMAQARAMQERLAEVQQALNARRFEATSGGGMVRATVTGALRILSIEIEDAFFKAGDKDMIQDLAAAAVNAALAKAQEGAQAEFARMQQQLLGGSAF